MEKIDAVLTSMNRLLLSMTMEWIDSGMLSAPDNRMSLSYSKMIQQMNKQMAANDIIRFFYVSSPEKGDFIYNANTGFTLNSPESIKDRIDKDSFLQKPVTFTQLSTWKRLDIDNQSYIHQSVGYHGYYIGIILDINIIFDASKFYDYTAIHSIPIFSTISGIPLNDEVYIQENEIELTWDFTDYYITGQNESTIITGVRSLNGDFGLMVLIPNRPEIFSFTYMRDFLVLVSAAVLIYIIVILILIRKYTLKPVKRLYVAMTQITDGKLDIKIQEQSTSDDFRLLNRTFNQMIEQIKTLKIETYEKKLALKNAEIEQLRMQINPHLFLNSLNLIYRLEADKSPYVSEAILSLIECFRYFVRQKDPFVTLRQELEYTNSYRRIQELTYPGRIFFHRDVPFFLEGFLVPTMTVLEFIENSIKYALPYTQRLEIMLTAQVEDMDGKSYLIINIKDNGPGYDEEILFLIRNNQTIIDEQDRKHIGIINYCKRIQHLYDGAAYIEFENLTTGGACVCIKLPVVEANNWTMNFPK